MQKISLIYPQFVLMNGRNALRLMHDGRQYYYYRDGGDYSVYINKHGDGSLSTVSPIGSMNGCNLIATTEEIWRKCNGQYAPYDFKHHGWQLATTDKSITKIETKNEYKYLLIRR